MTCSSMYRNTMMFVYVVTCVPLYAYIQMQELSNPLYDFTEEGPAWVYSKIFAGVWFFLYFCGLIYYVVKNFSTNFCTNKGQCRRCCDCSQPEEPERWRKSWIFVLHGWAILVGLSGLAFGFTYGLQMDTVFEFLFFYALFNLYIHTLTFLYTPSNLSDEGISMTDMEQLNDVHDDGSDEDCEADI